GRRRAVGPYAVDEVLRCHQQRPAGELLLKFADLARRMQPGIVADLAASWHELGDALRQSARSLLDNLDQAGVGFGWCLQRITAVDEQCGLAEADHGNAGGAGETGEVGEPRFTVWY